MNTEKFQKLGRDYLESNACGRWDGSRKADTHRSLCELFVSERLEVSPQKASALYVGSPLNFEKSSLIALVRSSTTILTDNLDTEIGFPLDVAPNYNRLTPVFVDRFISLASEWFDDNPSLMSDRLLITILESVTKNKFSSVFHALNSYGFDFVDGNPEGKNRFLIMKSKLKQVITIKPNKYFGCSFTLDKGIDQ